MKKIALWSSLALAICVGAFIAADHLDAPAVANTTADIADFYAFEGADSNSTTFVVTLPAANASAQFDENVLIEINIDNTGVDAGTTGVTEDLVIQALRQGDKMYFFGPYAPSTTGLNSTIDTNELSASVDIGSMTTAGGVNYFAGLRQDAFFFDFEAFNNVISMAPATGFGTTGNNTFAPLNVNAVVIEVPNSMLGTAPTHIVDQLLAPNGPGLPVAYNVWVETKRR
ncbi:DUF4331 family protein [Nonlabens mediterrranea]|uniref:DUF4331 family protein n=1 Tax=Nonlabens mediterrranea TaxID=1419947 RepID=A0ABS0A8U6_9FLAO|nr:hypothetical protein BBFL7_02142 [Flavobacteria bacterium BBFL7]MBF4985786.1 DUF4331 family protein [Nonlabens mediterrranea]